MSDRKNSRKKKVYIACGGSAGHIFPGLTLAEELSRRYGEDMEISFLTSSNKLARSLFGATRFNFHTLPLGRQIGASSYSRAFPLASLRKNLQFILSLLKGTFESVKIISSNRPDCLVGFGSYIAGPPFVIASLLGVPTLVHEQNAVMGKANRIMRPFATKVALSFPQKEDRKKKNIVFTGNPIRESAARIQDKRDAVVSLGMNTDKFTILVLGGSQGSRIINSITVEMLKNMQKQLRDKIQIIHISGDGDYERLKKIYQDIDIPYKLHSFFKDISIVYSAADIAVSRAGASTIYELCMHRIPSILIPYPFAENHQVENARFLAVRKAAIAIEESSLSKTPLLTEVENLISAEELRKSMREEMSSLVTSNAAERLADEVSSLLL